MKDYDYHSLFYYSILAKLQGYQDKKGNLLKPSKDEDRPQFEVFLCYEPRQDRFDHFYQRDKFVAERDKLVCIGKIGDQANMVVVMRVNRFEDKAIMYKKALRYLFGGNYAVAKRELTMLMDKFYELEVHDQSGLTKADFSASTDNANHHYVDRPIQKKVTETISFVPWG